MTDVPSVYPLPRPGTHPDVVVAAAHGDTNRVRQLLQQTSPEVVDEDGRSALWWAAFQGATRVVMELLDLVDVNRSDRNGSTPLMAASHSGHTDIAVALMKAGAKLDQCDQDGDGPLTAAAFKGHTETCTALLQAGADASRPNNMGATALGAAVCSGSAETVAVIIDAGADVNLANDLGAAPIWYALMYGLPDIADILVDAGATPAYCGHDPDHGKLALWYAVGGGCKARILEPLLEEGRDVDFGPEQSPLWLASSQGNLKVVMLLLKRRANMNMLGLGTGLGPEGVVEDVWSTPMTIATLNHFSSTAVALAKAGADIDKSDVSSPHGCSPLSIAALRGQAQMAETLLGLGASVNAVVSSTGMTPLHAAILCDHPDVVALFLEAGGDWVHPCKSWAARGIGHTRSVEIVAEVEGKRIASRFTMLALVRRAATMQTATEADAVVKQLGDLAGLPLEIIRMIAMMVFVPDRVWHYALSCSPAGLL